MKERLKQLRISLNMTQNEFAKKLGLTRISVARMESGDRNITERTKNDICREFNVNRQWLEKGEGATFNHIDDDLENLLNMASIDKDNSHVKLLKAISLLNNDDLELLEKLVDSLSKKNQNDHE